MTHHTVSTEGTQVHYWLAGPPDGPLIVLTHGVLLDHLQFIPQIRPLAQRYRVLTWDVPAHGLSQPQKGQFTVAGSARALLSILDEIQVRQAILIGVSMGAGISQELAYRHPERVRALALVGYRRITQAVSRSDRWRFRALLAYLSLRSRTSYDALRRSIAELAATKDTTRAYIDDACRRIPRRSLTGILWSLALGFHDDPQYRFGCPMLLMHGEHDQLADFAETMPEWAALEDDSQYDSIPDAGHVATMDNPAYFTAAVAKFLDDTLEQGDKTHAPSTLQYQADWQYTMPMVPGLSELSPYSRFILRTALRIWGRVSLPASC
jgi:pimeloyl-ACP methyl ester carboxylesterase